MRVSFVSSFITTQIKKNDNRPAMGDSLLSACTTGDYLFLSTCYDCCRFFSQRVTSFSLSTMMATSLAIRFSLRMRKDEGRKDEIGIEVKEKVDRGIRREKALHNPDAQHSESQNYITNTIRYRYHASVSERFSRFTRIAIHRYDLYRSPYDSYRIVRYISRIVRY
jgi:hypothetical protein